MSSGYFLFLQEQIKDIIIIGTVVINTKKNIGNSGRSLSPSTAPPDFNPDETCFQH
jgi:hypothetical protein